MPLRWSWHTSTRRRLGWVEGRLGWVEVSDVYAVVLAYLEPAEARLLEADLCDGGDPQGTWAHSGGPRRIGHRTDVYRRA